MIHTFNDKRGGCAPRHRNFLVFQSTQSTAVEFRGKSIPGCRVIRECYVKNGKWSHTTWKVELADGVQPLVFVQDRGTGEWWTQRTWEAAVSVEGFPFQGKDCEKFIRTFFPDTAKKLDAENYLRAEEPELSVFFDTAAKKQQEESK